MSNHQTLPDEPGHVVKFRHRRSDDIAAKEGPGHLSRYEGADEPDDYRHRMIMNIVVFMLVAGLIGGALWLANTMADMRKNQDCVLSGRAGCTPVNIPHQRY